MSFVALRLTNSGSLAAASNSLNAVGSSSTFSRSTTMPMFPRSDTQDELLLTDEIKAEVKRVLPSSDPNSWKGQAGKVGVLGGCLDTPAPAYFCAMAALRAGVDLAHVFTTKGAAPLIRGYSPDLSVHAVLPEPDAEAEQISGPGRDALISSCCAQLEAWFSRLDCLVLGPGLGRDPLLLDISRAVIISARRANLPLVLDGDGLLLVAREPDLVQGCASCILTPNLNEFRRLATTLGVPLHGQYNDRAAQLGRVVQQLGGPVLISKGPSDAIHDGTAFITCSATGSTRRCASQGDILSGVLAAMLSWALAFQRRAKSSTDNEAALEMKPSLLAAYGACLITRQSCRHAFNLKRRSMLASDMLDQLGLVVENLAAANAPATNSNTVN